MVEIFVVQVKAFNATTWGSRQHQCISGMCTVAKLSLSESCSETDLEKLFQPLVELQADELGTSGLGSLEAHD